MKIYLARHGQSTWQLEPSDDLDTPLSDTGHRQAQLLAAWLADHPALDGKGRLEVAALRTSPLKRAQETAGYVSRALGLPVEIQPTLTEAPFHVVEELPRAPAPFEPVPAGYRLPERYLRFREQAEEALTELAELSGQVGGPVLAVTHGGLIKTLLRVVAQTDLTCFQIYNSGIVALDWKNGRWRLLHLNLWDHLPPDLRLT
ncbi:histidine phosphatase family protein [Kitasatospora sp. CB02891]|uniref:histidine phosphatase family protein n=1 Tax=Kitasatospora sp. CB02891 TaxID=2020329 RepID=UPI000C270269|nr:histidine phosphatase family protein [Kitasatospora sp. CB02891]PJN24013.1 phosphoglycerate mutase [Kitasatospora sp. CB02891]